MELLTELRFVLLVLRFFADNFHITMCELAFVTVSALSWLNPVLTHFSLVFSLVYFALILLGLVLLALVGSCGLRKFMVVRSGIILNLLCWVTTWKLYSWVFSNINSLSASVACDVSKSWSWLVVRNVSKLLIVWWFLIHCFDLAICLLI